MTNRAARRTTAKQAGGLADEGARAEAGAYAKRIFTLNIERVAAKNLLREVVGQGLTPELAAKVATFLERHPD